MKTSFPALLTFAVVFLIGITSCQKKTSTNVPQITFTQLTPDTTQQGSPFDTVAIQFNITDNIANLASGYIYIKDSRFDTGFAADILPSVSVSGADPNEAVHALCTYYMLGANILVRPDSVHQKNGDTLHYEIYIQDQSGQASNHIITPNLYIKP